MLSLKNGRISSFSSAAWEEMDDTTRQLARDVLLEHSHDNNDDGSSTNNSSGSSSNSRSMLKRRIALSRSITLLETKSLHTYKQRQADALLTYLLEHKTDSSRTTGAASSNSRQNFRIGLAGPPGAGKSSLIEALGMYILEQWPLQPETQAQPQEKNDQPQSQSENWYCPSQLAVVCVDPSSSVSGGSILGDKTRMMELSRNERAFIRPSANAGVVGGLAAYTDDVVTCCHAAGYPLVLVETVGLGQSEIEVAQSVDMVLLLLSPGGGDDLQGVKKGIVEVADLLVVTKADGNLLPAAKRTAADYRGALQLLKGIESANRQTTYVPSTSSSNGCSEENVNHRHRHSTNEPHVLTWNPPVLLTSSATKEGIDILWKEICKYRHYKIQTGLLEERRKEQATYWMWKHLTQLVHVHIHHRDPALQQEARQLQATLDRGQVTPRVAATRLLNRLLLKKTD
jgi:LAO/AO transport system kinase